jgi:hypothetical protein
MMLWDGEPEPWRWVIVSGVLVLILMALFGFILYMAA